MTILYKIFDFPTLGVKSQIFYAGGAAIEGGLTSGGARVMTPEPGGRAFLEINLSLQANEWNFPFASWLMSKAANGTIFRIPLVKTPQLISDTTLSEIIRNTNEIMWADEAQYNSTTWDNSQGWSSEAVIEILETSLEGSQIIKVDISTIGKIIQYGHVIGIGDHAYMVDDIDYPEDETYVKITLNPPLRQNVRMSDLVLLRPYFLGTVTNISEFRTAYDKDNNGHITPGRLIFAESLI